MIINASLREERDFGGNLFKRFWQEEILVQINCAGTKGIIVIFFSKSSEFLNENNGILAKSLFPKKIYNVQKRIGRKAFGHYILEIER